MAENPDGQEKTELATPKRLEESRDRGQVAKSVDVTTAGMLLLGGITLFIFGSPFVNTYQSFMKEMFVMSAKYSLTELSANFIFDKFISIVAQLILPLISIIFIIALAGEVAQVGFKIATKKFTEGLRFKQIFNPFSGIRRLFLSTNSIFELVKNIIKILILGLVVWSVLNGKDELLISLMERPFTEIGKFMADVAFELFWKVGIIYIAIAVADFYYQKWRFKEDTKMTKKEVKDENRQAEGDPMIKGRIRSIMRNRLRKIMLQKVPKADVVITNPTHYAVALMYKSGEMSAPIVVAKGVDFLASKIKEIAVSNDVPIIENPPLARQLYKLVDIDQEIPETLFKAVAEVLAYIYTLRDKKYN